MKPDHDGQTAPAEVGALSYISWACVHFCHSLLLLLDCSGWFGGLPWRWGWRGRRWGRAVSKEAASFELLRLIVLCLVAVDGHWVPPILPPLVFSLVLGQPVPPVSLTEETGKDELPPHSVPPDLCSSFLPQWKKLEKSQISLFLQPVDFTSSPYQQPPLREPKLSFLCPEEKLIDPWQTHPSSLS